MARCIARRGFYRMIVTEKKLKRAKAHNTTSIMRNLAKTIVVVAVSAALFTLPTAKAAPHWITLIIAEIVAGKSTDAALNAWIAKNGDPRPLKEEPTNDSANDESKDCQKRRPAAIESLRQ